MGYMPGPGDLATWPPCEQHPHDPRTTLRDDLNLEAAALDAAQAFSLAVQSGADILLPDANGDRTVQLTGWLCNEMPDEATKALLLACQQAAHPSGNAAECAALLLGFVNAMAAQYGQATARAWA